MFEDFSQPWVRVAEEVELRVRTSARICVVGDRARAVDAGIRRWQDRRVLTATDGSSTYDARRRPR